ETRPVPSEFPSYPERAKNEATPSRPTSRAAHASGEPAPARIWFPRCPARRSRKPAEPPTRAQHPAATAIHSGVHNQTCCVIPPRCTAIPSPYHSKRGSPSRTGIRQAKVALPSNPATPPATAPQKTSLSRLPRCHNTTAPTTAPTHHVVTTKFFKNG